VRAQYGSTPLHIAACAGHASVVTVLCECGADKEAKGWVRNAAARGGGSGGRSG
jgi:hypothetical protein